jgi:hypothetical protein
MHPAVGERRNYRGQLYEVVDTIPHITRDGRKVTLLWIETKCVDCKQDFQIRETSRNFRRRRLLRRCEYCRKPGVPVGPVTRRREKSDTLTWVQERMWRVLVELAGEQRGRVSPGAQGWVRVKDWMNALVERDVLNEADVARNGAYHWMRRELMRKGRIEKCGPALRAL